MTKDLTNSQLDRQNILNNEIAVNEVWDTLEIRAVHWNNGYFLTKDMVSSYFQVDIRTIERYINSNSDELLANGMQTLRGKHLAEFIDAYNAEFATLMSVTKSGILLFLISGLSSTSGCYCPKVNVQRICGS